MKVIWRKSRMTFFIVVDFFPIFAIMRIIVVLILLVFGCQQTTVNGQQTSCTVPEPVEGTTLGASTSSATLIQKFRDLGVQGLR